MDQTLNQYWEPIKSVERLDESLYLLASNKGKDYPIHFLFNLFKFGHFRLIYFCFFPTLLIIFLLFNLFFVCFYPTWLSLCYIPKQKYLQNDKI